jgi:uncharacterized protein DUF4406
MKPIIYLGGPIAGCTDDEANGWRNETIEQFKDIYDFKNPMIRDSRGRYFNPNAIVEGDLEDIKASNIVLFNCWMASYGTPMEMVYAAKLYGKSVITIKCKPISPWIFYHSTILVPDLEAAWAELDKPIWQTYYG